MWKKNIKQILDKDSETFKITIKNYNNEKMNAILERYDELRIRIEEIRKSYSSLNEKIITEDELINSVKNLIDWYNTNINKIKS